MTEITRDSAQWELSRIWRSFKAGASLPSDISARMHNDGGAVIAIYPDVWIRQADAFVWRKAPPLETNL